MKKKSTKPSEGKGVLADTRLIVFYPELARTFDICGAFLIQQIHYWTQENPTIKDEQAFHRNTYEEWADQIGVYSSRTVANSLRDLEAQGVVITGRFNKHKYDKTLWYRLDYDKLAELVTLETGTEWKKFHLATGKIFLSLKEETSTPIPETIEEITRDKVNNNFSANATLIAKEQEIEQSLSLPAGKGKETPGVIKKTIEGDMIMANSEEILEEMKAKKEAKKLTTGESPLYAVYTRWQTHAGEAKFAKSLTLKDKGQLKLLYKSAGDKTLVVIDYAFEAWDHFVTKTKHAKGLEFGPTQPSIGFLLAHHDICWQLIAKKLEASQPAKALQDSIDKPIKASTLLPEDKPSAETIAASLAYFAAIAEKVD